MKLRGEVDNFGRDGFREGERMDLLGVEKMGCDDDATS